MRAVHQELSATLQRDPTDAELSSSLEIDLATFDCKRQALTRARSCALTGASDKAPQEAAWADPDPDPEAQRASSEARELLTTVLNRLPERPRAILRMYYLQGFTMREIALHFNVNESRISQIHRRALERMGRQLRASGIRSAAEI